jgi:peptide-methionine (R)-S-oxide reductase
MEKVIKTKEEWKNILTPEQFHILREKGTEAPFSCAFDIEKTNGTYMCAACGLPLFRAEKKFHSGTGWPSYAEPIHPAHITLLPDTSFGMHRTEVQCARCESHLGHVFEDGPPPTGRRYCINAICLRFLKEENT